MSNIRFEYSHITGMIQSIATIFNLASSDTVNVSQTAQDRTSISCENRNQDSSESESSEVTEQDLMLNSPSSAFDILSLLQEL